MVTNKEIVDYYDFSELDYKLYNGTFSEAISMHFGIWDENTHSHREALLNENRILAEIAGITKNDNVIDLGCGYGMSSIWLASHIGCHVTGITLSQKQVSVAKEYARKNGVEHLVDFYVMDFNATPFPDNSFDVAFAIESLCCSEDKQKLLKEIYRIMKSGGRFIDADGYFKKPKAQLTPREWEIARACCEGVHVPILPEKTEFETQLSGAGFSNIQWIEKTEAILRISKRISNMAGWIMPFSKILGWLGVRSLSPSHCRSFIDQYYAWRDGIGIYGIFYAKKG
jgi:cyclopropane fatty-acyl-phospholipid synthase-like methyltransferase